MIINRGSRECEHPQSEDRLDVPEKVENRSEKGNLRHAVRVLVIADEVVAAAVRRPAAVVGNGHDTVAELVRAQSRRRERATGGESSIPLDEVTEQVVRAAGHELGDVLPRGTRLQVRLTANLHTGGTIEDCTDELSLPIREAAVRAARTIGIPVTGIDFMVPDVTGEVFTFVEANERPGLANHQPRPTAARFVDLLFPATAGRAPRSGDRDD